MAMVKITTQDRSYKHDCSYKQINNHGPYLVNSVYKAKDIFLVTFKKQMAIWKIFNGVLILYHKSPC